MAEPKRQSDLALLWDPFRVKVEALLEALRDCGGGKSFAREGCHVQYGG